MKSFFLRWLRLASILPILLCIFAACRTDVWTATLDRYASDDAVDQLLFVKYLGDAAGVSAPEVAAGVSAPDAAGVTPGASVAIVEFYVKPAGFFTSATEADSDLVEGVWRLEFRDTAYVGRNGIGKTREGDGRTPEGEFGIRRAFGILPNPGAQIEYIQVTESIYACDEDSPYYNNIIDTSAVHHACRGENMIAETPSYDYGLETDYNPENVYPLGSAIFIHCKGSKPSTAGCVALSHETMRRLVQLASPDLLVCVHPF